MHREPFSFPLLGSGGQPLFETYHGENVRIEYTLKVNIDRGVFPRKLKNEIEFFVHSNPITYHPTGQIIKITPNSVVGNFGKLPDFKVVGFLNTTTCPLESSLTGELNVESCVVPILSIELQLLRTESVSKGGTVKMIRDYYLSCHRMNAEDRDIQHSLDRMTQTTSLGFFPIGDNNVPLKSPVKFSVDFPRHICSPTITCDGFNVEYELNFIFFLKDGSQFSQKHQIMLYRGK